MTRPFSLLPSYYRGASLETEEKAFFGLVFSVLSRDASSLLVATITRERVLSPALATQFLEYPKKAQVQS